MSSAGRPNQDGVDQIIEFGPIDRTVDPLEEFPGFREEQRVRHVDAIQLAIDLSVTIDREIVGDARDGDEVLRIGAENNRG